MEGLVRNPTTHPIRPRTDLRWAILVVKRSGEALFYAGHGKPLDRSALFAERYGTAADAEEALWRVDAGYGDKVRIIDLA
jgi:hypothetical protein